MTEEDGQFSDLYPSDDDRNVNEEPSSSGFISDQEDDDGIFLSPFCSQATESHYKILKDPIHGHLRLEKYCVDVVDTPQFQRLRDLKQLGTCYYVFPGASHNRFEHSIGVCHLAGELIDRLKRTQPELGITENDTRLIRLAGLCHDLGHGPFSHVFDSEFIPRALPGSRWKHETGSLMMLDYLVDDSENEIDWDADDLQFVKELICPERYSTKSRHDKFYYQIVANADSGIDVDKYDYIARDSYNLGLKSSYDFSRLMNFCKVIDGELCFHSKEVYNVYELFHSRYSLFKQVYTHRVGKAVEYMINDALLAANEHLKIAEAISDPSRYVHLSDSIIHQIEYSTDPELGPARSILQRLRRRELYRFVDEVLIPPQLASHFANVKPEDITQQQPTGSLLQPEDIIIHNLRIDYAMKEKNPVDSVKFYQQWTDKTSVNIPKYKVSCLIPEKFQERYVRVYARDPRKSKAVKLAFKNYVKEFNLHLHEHRNVHNATREALANADHMQAEVSVVEEGSSMKRARFEE